jgi:hypothetical protein
MSADDDSAYDDSAYDGKPAVTFSRAASGRYRVEFDYHHETVELLKSTVPAPMRRWIPDERCWEISPDWTGPLHSELRNAGFDVDGLDEDNIADWFAPFTTPAPTSDKGRRAYLKGLCKTCTTSPHRAGGTECEKCFHDRLTRQYRVTRALADAGLTPWPQAQHAEGDAWETHAPVPRILADS